MTTSTLTDVDEIMFRQVHLSFIEDGQPSSQPFRPTPKYEGQLSVDRSSPTTAKASYDLFVAGGALSAAVYGLTIGEFGNEGVMCYPDAIPAGDGVLPSAAHAYADFTMHSENKSKTIAKRLKLRALARGQLHP